MSVEGVVISKGTPGASTLQGADSASGMLLPGIAATGLALGVTKELNQLSDAEAIGIDAAYDTTNAVRVHYHIKEFYRMAPEGTKLYIMLVDNTVTVSDLDVTMVNMVEDLTSIYAKKLIVDAGGEIKQLGVAMNPAAGYVSTLLDGLDGDVIGAIPKAQELAEWGLSTHRPFQVILEGREFNGLAAAAQDLRNITDVAATKVSVVIGQDWDYADALDALGEKHAAIGTALGTVAAAKVNQNIGEVEVFNLTDAGKSAFLTAGFSSHDKAIDKEVDWNTLDGKGYIFGITYTGTDGVRWNDDHTCVPIVEDQDGLINEHTISLGRTVDKAARLLRAALLPKVKSVQKLDPVTGKLSIVTVEYFNGLGDLEFGDMEAASEIVEGKTAVDPDSDLITAPRNLLVDFSLSPYGTIGTIKGTINIKRTL